MTRLVGASSTGTPDGTRPEIEVAHARRLVHFSTHLLVTDEAAVGQGTTVPRVIARRRDVSEARYAGLLTTTVGGHVESGLSPAESLRKAARRHGVEIGALHYVGTFEIDDDDEREVCTLWTGGIDLARTTATFETVAVDGLCDGEATPHLGAALAIWRATKCS